MANDKKQKEEQNEIPSKPIELMSDSERNLFYGICATYGAFPENTAMLKQMIYSRINEETAKFNIQVGSMHTHLKYIDLLEK